MLNCCVCCRRSACLFASEYVFCVCVHVHRELCLALNAMPQKCRPFRHQYYERIAETDMTKHADWRNGEGIYHPFPALYTSFLDAFEVTAEVLMSPIDVRTTLLSASQIQKIYNKNKPRMDKITGHSPCTQIYPVVCVLE